MPTKNNCPTCRQPTQEKCCQARLDALERTIHDVLRLLRAELAGAPSLASESTPTLQAVERRLRAQ